MDLGMPSCALFAMLLITAMVTTAAASPVLQTPALAAQPVAAPGSG